MTNYKFLILLVLFSGVLLVAPAVIRQFNNNPYMINSAAYNTERLYTQGSLNYDSLQAHGTEFNMINLLRFGSTGTYILFNIVPLVLGILTVIITYFALLKHNIPEKTTYTILALMIVSPIFLHIFSDFEIYSFIIFLNFLGLYFLMDNKTLLSSIIFCIIPFIDIFSGMVTLVLLLTYMFINGKRYDSHRITGIALFAAIILAIVINVYYGYNIWHIFQFESQNIITDIGASVGLSFSIIILAVIGLVLLWENGWKNLVTYILMIVFIVISFFNNTMRIYINFVLVIYAGFAFMYLNRRKWSISIIKKTTILLIICSIFFSTLVYTTNIIKSEPGPEYINALMFLKNQSLPTETVLSYPAYGYMIEYYTDRQVLVDDSTRYYDAEKVSAQERITTSRNLERTESMLKQYNIKYIIVDTDFDKYLIEKDGLSFLIDNSKKFTSIYKNDRVEIWMYTG